jgi:hypothetical protein
MWVADDERHFHTKQECEDYEAARRMLKAFELEHDDPTAVSLESVFAWVTKNYVIAFQTLKG